MNLLDLMVKIGVDDKSSDKIKGISGNIKSGLVTAAKAGAKAIAAATTSAAAGAAAIGKAALESYSSYEQLSGGVQKLFGEEAGAQVMQYAQRAYQTAGMSANQYMEQATGFSAALINSLGGDTQKAAEMTDVAMRAMSDNVNTFGSNAEDVQNAIMGISRQNYTMVDNLKLGYAGTKEGMEQLIADANAWGAANGEASDLSIDSFADCVQAIQQVQEAQGISGTTAKEAGRTIEGSVNSAKAAWANLVTELGKPDADIGSRMTELVTSIFGDGTENNLGVFGNVMPAIENIMTNAQKAIGDAMPQITSAIETYLPMVLDAVTSLAPALLEVAGQLFLCIAKGALDALPQVLNALGDMLNQLVDDVVNNRENMMQGATEWFQGMAEALANFVPALLTAVIVLLGMAMEAVGQAAGQMLAAASLWLMGVFDAIGEAAGQIGGAIGELVQAGVDEVGNFVGSMFTAGANLVQGLIDGIGSLIDSVATKVRNGVEGAVNGVKSFLGISSPSKLMRGIGQFTMEGMAEGIEDTAGKAEKAMRSAVDGIYGAADIGMTDQIGALGFGMAGSGGMGANGQNRALNAASGPLIAISIDTMEVREEADINRIAEQLYQKMSRQMGGSLWSASYSAV